MKTIRMICAGLLFVSLVALAGCPGNIQQGGSSSEQSTESSGGGGGD